MTANKPHKLKACLTSNKQDYRTPRALFDKLNSKYDFTIDAAADESNALCNRFWTEEIDALKMDWDNERVWCNPPYNRAGEFVTKAIDSDALVVMLLPSRTGTEWFKRLLETDTRPIHIEYLRGRLKFEGADNSAPFDSILVYLL